MIRVLLIDDHTIVRQAFRSLLTSAKDIQIVGEAGTGTEGVQLARELHPSVIILDLKLPDISGLEVTARCLRLEPAPKILVVSSTSHHEYSQRILEMGASGYLTKDTDREELIRAIKRSIKASLSSAPRSPADWPWLKLIIKPTLFLIC